MICLFFLSVCCASLGAQEAPKPKLEKWQINGIVAALEDGHSDVKQKAFEEFFEFDEKALKAFTKNEPQQEWYCRHDKIMEYFIVQTFLGNSETSQNRLYEHIGDSHFRGVYFLLATLLPLEKAADLREELINYAADTKDHTVSDTFVQLFRSRATLSANPTPLSQ